MTCALPPDGAIAGRFAKHVVLSVLALTAPLAAGDPPLPRFTDVSAQSGLRFRHNFGGKKLESILMTTGSGCALFDYDNDGWLDAFLVNGIDIDKDGRPLGSTGRTSRHALFHNNGDGTFKKVTQHAGLAEPSYGQGCACGDYDGDGFTDLYITNYGSNRLFRNRGDGTFEDATARSGTGDSRWSTGAMFFDYDGDHDLDLYVANYLKFGPDVKDVHASALSKRTGFRFFPGPRDYDAEDDILYRNNGDGTFTDVSKQVQLASGGKGMTVIAADFDDDGDQDLFVANDETPNFFYRNDGGQFSEIALLAGVAYDPNGSETGAMGVDVVDADFDGKQDLYVTNFGFEFNNFYRNLGELVFEDVTKRLRLDRDNYRHVAWATRFVDFNHDGLLDCFVANGHVVDYVEGLSQGLTYRQQNMLFVGQDNGTFTNVADRCGQCFRKKRVSRGAALADYDNDGDIDILIVNSGGRAELLRNDFPTSDRWLKIRLEGRPPNTRGIGAKIRVRLGARVVSWQVSFAGTYLSSSDPTLHVGLAADVTEAIIEVTWPSGRRSLRTVSPGQEIVIQEPEKATPDQ